MNIKIGLFFLILITYVYSVIVDEAQFADLISKIDDEIIINIDSEIYISNDFIVNDNHKKIIIIGKSVETSFIKFENLSNKLYFGENVKEIEIKNISIIGNIFFNNIKSVFFDSVSITGNIDSYFDIDINDYIKFKNVTYNPSSYSSDNCINLSGNVEIVDSTFKGSSQCNNRLFNFFGLEYYDLYIENSNFSGEYKCGCVNIDKGHEVNIYKSTFDNAYVPKIFEGGGGLKIKNSNTHLKNCNFTNNYVMHEGGALYLEDIFGFEADGLEVVNNTAIYKGSMVFISTIEDIGSTAIFKNIRQINTGINNERIQEGGLGFSLTKFASINLENYYGENLCNYYNAGHVFDLIEYASIVMNNVELNHIRGNSIDGLFLFTNYEDNVYVRATNIILNDLYQFSDRPSSILFWINRKARIEIENIRFSNVGAYNAYLTYQGDECFVNINNIELSNYYSSTASEIFSYSSLAETDGILNISHLRLDNIISQGAIFKSSFGVISVSDSVITNIHTCNRDNSCRNKQGIMELYLNNEIAAINSKSEITIKNTIFDNINGVSGLGAADGTSIYFYNNTIKNSYFKNGIIECDRSKEKSGNITVENSVFINNKSEYGTILNIQLLDERYHTRINIINSKFENNTASKYGGVIYSKDKLTPKSVKVENCEFINNKALIGNDIYTLKIDYEPLISNREYLKNIKGSLATNPTKIKLNNDTFNDLLIKSGDKIPEGITCSIYDDYDNKIMFGSDIANVEISEFMFFKLEVNDTYNSALVGQTRSYCWDNFCEFPIVRVVGNPGVYKLKLIINTFGRFTNFDDNTVDIKIKIIPCENNYLYQDIENIKLKSCYKPSCEPSCNTGTCINNNICSCNNTLFTGSYCNEYIKLKRISVIDISIRIISIILIIVTIITIFSTIYLRNNPIIKGGSVDFLIIILIGLIFSFSHVFFLTVERTTNKCYLIHLLNNIGFSLSYGSILVKTIRIYLIFRIKRRSIGLKKKIMLSIVMTLVIYYIVINLIWYVTGNVSAKSAITEDYKKYQYCSYPDFRVMCIIVNYIVLFLGCYFSYCIRKVKDNFKENLAIPIYAYFIFIGISELANSLYNISVRVQDFFNSTGTIIINSAILLYLYIIKFYTIYSLKKISKQKSSYKNSKSSSQYT